MILTQLDKLGVMIVGETITALSDLVNIAGVSGVVVIFWSFMPLLMIFLLMMIVRISTKQAKQNNEMFATQIGDLTKAISILTDKVSSPYNNTEKSLLIFYTVMSNHIYKKSKFLGEVLEHNSLHDREKQIKHNIENKFKSITNEEAAKLSKFKSVCGDMGKILQESIDWDDLLERVYKIIFSDFKDHQKIMDIQTMMNSEVDDIAKIIENNGIHN